MAEPSELDDLSTEPRWSLLSTLATILVFFVFAGLVGLTYYFGSGLDTKSPAASGEDQLKELRATEQATLTSYSYDEQTKSWRVPIAQAMESLVQEGESKGKWESFPKSPKK